MKAHRTDGVSLTFALIFLGVAAWWLFAQLTQLALPAVGWLLASALIAIGALGLVGALRSNRSGRRQATQPEGTTTTEPSAASTTRGADISTPDADIFGAGAVDAPTREFDRPGVDEPSTVALDRPTADLFDRPRDRTGDPGGSDRGEERRP
ncbi:hypothetical protein ACFP2T_25460 [Plantactinospora solaniradicis]|uniref:Uncharacterized protein n=1 Tax=Plantactinospora solaniradicis TaxID=1723736 RepID=A0ABW1KD34_9ACTN